MSKHVCLQCGKDFETDRRASRYCSRQCHAESRRQFAKKACLACGVTFVPRHSKSVYCSRSCAAKDAVANGLICQTKLEPRVCPSCGKTFKPRNAESQYCSVRCFGQSLKRERKVCALCGKLFAPVDGQSKYCSNECNGESKKKRVVIHCEVCKSEMHVIPFIAKERRFCSEKCRITGLGGAMTTPEKRTQAILQELGVGFCSQFPVPGTPYIVDFLVGDNVVIQVDGVYWHAHPMFEPLNEKQQKRREKDKRCNKVLEAQGYKVHRIWENDVTLDTIRGILQREGIVNGTIQT